MECTCKVNQRRLIPAVFNLKQYLNNTETMIWTLDNTVINNGGCDLCDYDAFLIMYNGGIFDEVILSKQKDENGNLKVLWNTSDNKTSLRGTVRYQIAFKGANNGEIGVFSTVIPEANGIYSVTDGNAAGTFRIFANDTNGYKVQWDGNNQRWALYNADGVMIDFQTIAADEPYSGGWRNIVVSNNTAAVWYSDEAIMFISESIAADQNITANFPTILRQFYLQTQSKFVSAGAVVFDSEITTGMWQGETAPYFINLHEIISIPPECTIGNVSLFELDAEGNYINVTNFQHQTNGKQHVIYSLEKITGKVAALINGGNDHVFIAKEDIGEGGVTSVNGMYGTVKLTLADLGGVSAEDFKKSTEEFNQKTEDMEKSMEDMSNEFNDAIGDINSILDNINGEVI